MTKTPVSILQEMMVQRQSLPNYELIHDGGGTHMNIFTYRVSCDGLTATGTGRSKKDAKHEAAKAMLEAIAAKRSYPQLPASPAESPIRTPLPPTVPESPRVPPNLPFVNAIGSLQELCAENKLQDPEYVLISDVGPPHAKIFTIQCKVASFKETGIAKTKKQAKQDAAKKMLEKLIDLVPTWESMPNASMLHANGKECNDAKTQECIRQYAALSKKQNVKKMNLGIKVSEYHTQLSSSFDGETRNTLIEKVKSIMPENSDTISSEIVKNIVTDFKEILSGVDLDMFSHTIASTSVVIVMGIDASPSIVQVGVGETITEAESRAILNLMNTFIYLLE